MLELIRKRMIALRLLEGLTQEKLAEKMGLSRSHIANFERGGYMPSKISILDYCFFFDVSEDYFKESNPSQKDRELLNRIFKFLLHEEIKDRESIPEFFQNHVCNALQEYVFYLLKSTYFYAKREIEEAKKIEENYLKLFQFDLNSAEYDSFTRKCQLFYQAEKSYCMGSYNDAIEHWEAILLLEDIPNDKIRASLKMIACYYRNQDYVKVYRFAKIVITELETMEEPILLAKAYSLLSASYGQLNMFEEELAVLDKLEVLIEHYQLSNEKIVLYNNRGYVYSNCNRLSDALINYQKALHCATTPERYISALISNIHCLIALGQYTIASEYINEMQSRKLSEREKMIALSYEAELLLYKGDEKESWKKQKIALEYFLENDRLHNVSYIYSQLARYFLEKKAFKKAAIYMERKEDIIHEKNSKLLADN